MGKEQLEAYEEVDTLLDSAKFPHAIEKIKSWNKVWVNQFYQTHPERYRILKHEGFNELWTEKRVALNQKIGFVAQKRVADFDFVLGYVFYLFALKAENTNSKSIEYLQLALKFNSIHAAQTLLARVLAPKDGDKAEKMETITGLLLNWNTLAALHGAPGFLLLANGYLSLANLAAELNDTKAYEDACCSLWENLILAELDAPQATASIHNAYFGQGLELSNPFQIDTIDALKEKLSGLIKDDSIKQRAEHSARASFIDDASKTNLLTWMHSKTTDKSSPSVGYEPINISPRL